MGRKWGPGAERRRTSAANWKEPVRWAKAARAAGRRDKVFGGSLMDPFDKESSFETRLDYWKLIGDTCDAIDWQLVTKRPENIANVLAEDSLPYNFFEIVTAWLLVSTENQDAANKRIPIFLSIPATVHGISAEPLIGPLNIERWTQIAWQCSGLGSGIDWVICGGESGAQARIMKPEWARSLRDQCAATGTAFFMKQMGSVFGPNKGHDLPEDLKIRQFPKACTE